MYICMFCAIIVQFICKPSVDRLCGCIYSSRNATLGSGLVCTYWCTLYIQSMPLSLLSVYAPLLFLYSHTHTGSVDPPSSELSSQEGEAMDQETAEEQDGEQTKRGPQQDEPERRQQQVKRWHNLLLHLCTAAIPSSVQCYM